MYNNKDLKLFIFTKLGVSAARGPISLHSVAEQYPHIADQLLPNLAESYPAIFGKITEPIRQDRGNTIESQNLIFLYLNDLNKFIDQIV